MNQIRKAFAIIRDQGLSGLFRKLIRRWVYRRDLQIMLVKDLQADTYKLTRKSKYQFRILVYPDDIERLKKYVPERIPVFKRWSGQGVVVIGVEDGEGNIIALEAIVTGGYYEPELNYRFESVLVTGTASLVG